MYNTSLCVSPVKKVFCWHICFCSVFISPYTSTSYHTQVSGVFCVFFNSSQLYVGPYARILFCITYVYIQLAVRCSLVWSPSILAKYNRNANENRYIFLLIVIKGVWLKFISIDTKTILTLSNYKINSTYIVYKQQCIMYILQLVSKYTLQQKNLI